MVKPKDSWLFPQHSARQLPQLNCTSTLLQQGQQNVFPSSMNHCTVSTDVAFPGFRVPGLHGSGKGQTNAAHGLFHCLPTHLDCLPYTSSPYVKKEPNVVSGPTQRRFIIFDQSRNQTRLFLSPIRPPAQNIIVAPTKFLDACDMGGKGQPDKMVQNFPTKPTIQEKSNEIQIIGEGSEMHEDTEEINALLYSDDDGGDSEEDEVTSTDRSPFTIKGGSYKKREQQQQTNQRKNKKMEQRNHGGHVVVLPYPSQGHINPLLQFAKRLASKGVKATLATTHYTVKSICVPNIAVEPISDGFDNGGFTQARAEDVYLKSLRENGSRTLSQLIEKHKNTNFPINCVVYDSFFPWALDVAKTHGIYGAPFFTNSATVCAIFCHVHHGLVKLPVKVEELPLVLPGIPPLNLVDLPSFVQAPESYPAYLAMKLSQYSNLDKADWVFGNTFEELEGEAVKNVLELWPGKMIGPMVPSAYLDGRIEGDKGYGASLWKPLSSDCAKWLEAKPSQSVVYVSFGSMVSLTEEQMEEMAWGLKGSNLDFIWVVRESEITKLPSKFTNSTAQEKGLIVTWCNQLEMLAHQAIGCFVTHCGWNSTLEGLSLGVPMVGVPKWTDQLTDAKFIEEIWGVGVRAKQDEKGVVRREELMGCLKEVMEGERSVEIRKNCCKWKELAKEAISEGGSSDKSIDEFVEQLKSGNEKGVVKYLTNGNGHY